MTVEIQAENRFIKDLHQQNEECLNGMWRGENGVSGTATVATSWYLRATGSSRGNNAAAPQNGRGWPLHARRHEQSKAQHGFPGEHRLLCVLPVSHDPLSSLPHQNLQIKDGIGRTGMADPCGIARVWGPQFSLLTVQPETDLLTRIPTQSEAFREYFSGPQTCQFLCLHPPPRLGCCPSGFSAYLSLSEASGYPWDDGPSFLNTLSSSMVVSSQELWELHGLGCSLSLLGKLLVPPHTLHSDERHPCLCHLDYFQHHTQCLE